ncbi:DNA internalization-related competence protein ComEC/Rec2 [Virgibacillus sp. NKC19-16]|uniref:DNA internalization-related competence protein ComEC/Rec2 n=1 Tax=Virgibacillus salidurans TaxID=2831673 RepID=UPI001F3651B0|nr:DNA internalization-related competence protein ComEC/Rec2 [Virgibacillus sp. NKC19-16]UJL44896.1 DNA internalization-related competence protein ComEC/Rec2 [Virgibacillus sp. NKC19-16]
MKGYWHFTAISVAIGILTIVFNNYWFIAGFLLWLFYLYYYERLGKVPIFISLTFFLFFILYIPSIDGVNVKPPPESTQHTGQIIGPVNTTTEKIDFLFQDYESESKTIIVYFPENKDQPPSLEENSTIKYGATCILQGSMEIPEESRNPGQFDYRNYLLTNDIYYQLIVNTLDDIQCEGSTFLHRIYTLRDKLLNQIDSNLSIETAAWLSALVLGDDSRISEDTVELFQRWSLSHILAISGLHVGLVVGLIYFMLIKLNIVTKEKAQWIMIFFLPVYALIAGGEPSVWRASTMVLIFIILSKTKLKFSVTDVLSVVFLLLILFDPYVVYHVGFQLSFIVTFGLILSRKWISDTSTRYMQIFQIGFISQMMILPLLLAYFSTFQPLSVLLNWIVVPYFSLFVIPLMFILLLLTPLPPVFTVIFDALFVSINKIVIGFIEFVDAHMSFPWIIGGLPIGITVIYYILFFIFMRNLQHKKLKQAFIYGSCITILIMCAAIRPYVSPVGTVTMLDIGQGDAFVIELPYRQGVIFIDAGASFSFGDMEPTDSVYKQIIKPYLHSRGINKIDAVFLSHEDTDHIGSIPFMIEEMDVEKIIISNFYELSQETAESWYNHGVQIQQAGRNEIMEVNGKEFYVLAPYKDHFSANENSLVLYTAFGGKYWLFAGDIGKSEEKEIIRTYQNLPVDVLKVAHHGSDTSTDEAFLSHINADYALISVGENNSYGHPSLDVLETLKEEGVDLLRTDMDGAVQYRFKDKEGTFFKYLP